MIPQAFSEFRERVFVTSSLPGPPLHLLDGCVTIMGIILWFSAAIEESLDTSNCQLGTFFTVMWRLACLVRWSLRMNLLSHIGQANFFSPVWVLLCRESSSDLAKRLSHPSHTHWNGFSPAWIKRGGFRRFRSYLHFSQLQPIWNSNASIHCWHIINN